jgi:hypothetical protein
MPEYRHGQNERAATGYEPARSHVMQEAATASRALAITVSTRLMVAFQVTHLLTIAAWYWRARLRRRAEGALMNSTRTANRIALAFRMLFAGSRLGCAVRSV